MIHEDVIKLEGNTTKIFNTGETVRSKDTRLFLGENSSNRNIQTYHAPKYPWILEFAEELRALGNWSKNEIDLSKEKKDFDSLSKAGRHIFEKGLKFGIALDSCAGRSPLRLFSESGLSNNPEWELYLTNHQNNELLHSESYTEMVRAIFNDVDDFIESIITDDFVLQRAESILKELDKVTDILNRRDANLTAWDAGWQNTVFHRSDDEDFINDNLVKKCIYKSAIILNMFEGIRFFATFVTAWSFSEQPEKLLAGSSNIFKLIARDEMIHLDVFQKVIKLLRTSEEEGFFEVGGSRFKRWISVCDTGETGIAAELQFEGCGTVIIVVWIPVAKVNCVPASLSQGQAHVRDICIRNSTDHRAISGCDQSLVGDGRPAPVPGFY